MTKAKISRVLASLLLLAVACLPLRAADKSSHAYVVLVGIDKYADKQIKPRAHAEADARAMFDLFTNKDFLGVEAENIQLLLGTADKTAKTEVATHDNILKAVRWVAGKAGAEDLVVLAFFVQGAPLGESGGRMCYFASDSTIKDRGKNAIAAADLQQELDKLKSRRLCTFLDVNYRGYEDAPEKVPEPTIGAATYREFLGADGKEGVEGKDDGAGAPGRALFLASGGIVPSIEKEKNGMFAEVIVAGLKGAADKEGYEPDGVVTVDELGKFMEKRYLEGAPKIAKKDDERKLIARFYENRSGHFILTRNPAVAPKVADRITKIAKLKEDGKISEEIAAEGRKLLTRMPKLKSQQNLRKDYQKLADGSLSVEEFSKERKNIISGTKLEREVATAFAAKVIQSTQIIRENYVKPITQADLVGWAIRGLYRQIDEKIPPDVRERLEGIKNLDERQLTTLLADVRESLGQREDLDTHKDIDGALQRMLSNLDPYTTYFDPETVARFQQETTGRFPGIGIQIRENRSRGGLMVISPIKGSPAYKAGILAGDLITTITREVDKEGKPLPEPEVITTKGMTSSEAVKKITGKPGTKVSVTVEREGVEKPIVFELVRAFVEVETVTGVKRTNKDEWDYYVDPASKICYVRVTTFARNTARDLKHVVEKLDKEGVNGFILDLRFNPGGLLTSAVDISDMFIDDGLIVTIRNRAGKEVSYKGESDGSFLNFPMVCLVNGSSASGSEIVSACLQDHDRALVMGERSYGKGSVQNIQPFEGGELKFTTASFHRPSGRNLNKSSTQGKADEDWGVIPNPGFVLELSEKEKAQLDEYLHDTEIIQRKDSKKKDPDFKDKQLEMALDYLRGQIKKTPPKVTAKGD